MSSPEKLAEQYKYLKDTEREDVKLREALCTGSGASPAEMVILDTVPGMDPKGSCLVCGSYLTLDWYRLPEHSEVARG